jgi:4-methyl-5(b-hydroxyethyl)-thiazole monophosphate biosynthesis
MLVLPGGMPGTKHLLKHQGLAEEIKEFNNAGKMLAAICAAPIVLAATGVLTGKKVTCYPGYEEQLNGALYVKESVVCNTNVITSRGLGTAIDFSLAIIAHFKGIEKAEELKHAVIYEQ